MGGNMDPNRGTGTASPPQVPKIPIPEDKLQDIKDAYNALGDRMEAAGLPRPPHWG